MPYSIGHSGGGYAPGLVNPSLMPYAAAPQGLQHYPPEMWPAIRGYSIGDAAAAGLAAGNPAYGIPPVSDAGPMGQPFAVLRRVLVGFDSGTTDIAAGATFSVSVTIQVPFRPERFHVNPLTAANFILSQIVIGVIPQLAAVGNVPAAMFVPEATLPLTFDTAQQGQIITISGTNISGAGSRFLAGMVGTALR